MKILFYGDSITDTGRNDHAGSTIDIGQGYTLIVDAYLSVKYPGRYTFVNRGISGNRIVDLYARINCDVWAHCPDVMSILCGVNDVRHEYAHHNGVDAERFEAVYRMTVADTLRRFPNMKMILMEPFELPNEIIAERFEETLNEVKLRAAAVKKVAEEFGLVFLPLQQMFDDACKICPPEYWVADGVHPTPAGHQLIANAWIKAFEEKIKK